MVDVNLDTSALGQLSHDQKELLDIIDDLRSLGVGDLVNLPQIVVIGDQSSGRSSVLEAISRVRFPVKGGLCTRFATELVLRKSAQVKIEVTIKPAYSPPLGFAANASRDRQPWPHQTSFSKDELPRLIENAKKMMGIREGSTGFSEDTLRVEVSSPGLQPLTLVDLPGFYHSETSEQSPEDMSIVSRLVQRYIRQKNSIILAVVSAKNDLANQIVLAEAKRHDPSRERTIGIVTKPDTLTSGSSDETKYVKLVMNEEKAHVLKLGWHALRNRDDKENMADERVSDEKRDENEQEFFQTGRWPTVPRDLKGVEALQKKLSRVLMQHIKFSLPGVIQDIETGLEARRLTLERLGKARTTPSDLKDYLLGIADRFRDLSRAAVKGTYDGKFFNGTCKDGTWPGHAGSDPRRLRAVVRNLNRTFNVVIYAKGLKNEIKRADDAHDGDIGGRETPEVPESLEPWAELYGVDDPEIISFAELRKMLEKWASNNQGTQFPGSPNDRHALELFREQSCRWKDIARKHLELVTNAAKGFAELALGHVVGSDDSTYDAILRECIDPFFEERETELENKLQELLWHYREGDAICLEDEFRTRLSSQTTRRLATQVKNILRSEYPNMFVDGKKEKLTDRMIVQAITNAPDGEVSQFGTERVLDMMHAYYELSLRTFTNNIIILAVENCLISQLPNLLTTTTVHAMDDETLVRLAAESPDASQDRRALERDIKVLTKGLRFCKRHGPRGPTVAPSPTRSPLATPPGSFRGSLKVPTPNNALRCQESGTPAAVNPSQKGNKNLSAVTSALESATATPQPIKAAPSYNATTGSPLNTSPFATSTKAPPLFSAQASGPKPVSLLSTARKCQHRIDTFP